MLQNQITRKNLQQVGEAIHPELGAKMVKDFQDEHPTEVTSYYIGRNILEEILAQPGCQGIKFYNALNEMGTKTLVYVGIDKDEQIIAEYIQVDNTGELTRRKGIVADRVQTPPPSTPTPRP